MCHITSPLHVLVSISCVIVLCHQSPEIHSRAPSCSRNTFFFSCLSFVTPPPQSFTCNGYTGTTNIYAKCQIMQREKPFWTRTLSRRDTHFYMRSILTFKSRPLRIRHIHRVQVKDALRTGIWHEIRNSRAVILKLVYNVIFPNKKLWLGQHSRFLCLLTIIKCVVV